MAPLLIHSMRELSSLILPALAAAHARRIVEVGAEHGGMSSMLADYVSQAQGELISVDPAPSPAFVEWLADNPQVTHLPLPSLEVLAEIGSADAWFLDGDHNWYTVFNELALIRAAAQRDRRPLLVFLHDIGWPCARRDFYYAPDRIPSEFCHPYDYTGGVHLDTTVLQPNRGLRGMGHFAWAQHEGGPRNGVLTAVEDFVAQEQLCGRELAWANIPAVFGMGVLFDMQAPWAGAMADVLAPWHNHPLLLALEENRLRNYLTVLEWQDGHRVREPGETTERPVAA